MLVKYCLTTGLAVKVKQCHGGMGLFFIPRFCTNLKKLGQKPYIHVSILLLPMLGCIIQTVVGLVYVLVIPVLFNDFAQIVKVPLC